MISRDVKYICTKCKNTFVKAESCMPSVNLKCQECGGELHMGNMNMLDYLNPVEKLKSIKHSLKDMYSSIKK